MKRLLIGLIIAVLSIALLAGVAMAGVGGSPGAEEKQSTSSPKAWLGITLANVNGKLKEHLKLTVDSGVVVIKVAPEGPAHAAGIKPGDVIKAINGETVKNVGQVISTVRALSAGTVVTLTLVRGDTEVSAPVTLAAPPQPLVPPYVMPLLGASHFSKLVQGEFQVLDQDNKVISIKVTPGTFESATDAGMITILRRDGKVVTFQSNPETKVLAGRHPINVAGLKKGTPVTAVEKDGGLMLVIGWPADLLRHDKPKADRGGHPGAPHAKGKPFQTPDGATMPGQDSKAWTKGLRGHRDNDQGMGTLPKPPMDAGHTRSTVPAPLGLGETI